MHGHDYLKFTHAAAATANCARCRRFISKYPFLMRWIQTFSHYCYCTWFVFEGLLWSAGIAAFGTHISWYCKTALLRIL